MDSYSAQGASIFSGDFAATKEQEKRDHLGRAVAARDSMEARKTASQQAVSNYFYMHLKHPAESHRQQSPSTGEQLPSFQNDPLSSSNELAGSQLSGKAGKKRAEETEGQVLQEFIFFNSCDEDYKSRSAFAAEATKEEER